MGRSILDVVRGKQAAVPAAKPEIQHRQYCIDAQAKYKAWAQENPYHCPECQGRGIVGYEQDRDTGGGDYITCEHCFDEGICPVCGIPLGKVYACPTCGEEMDENGYCPICGDFIDASNYEHCDACGWDFDDASTHSPYAECSCYEDEINCGPETDTVEFYVEELPPGWEEEYPYALSDFAHDAAREKQNLGRR